ncbi:EIIBCA-Bgl [Ewingella americana]|uniref:EIIBCA-Bgl n=1 Tax=Ewingella americana TaxID=41202 RepID=A0A377THE3_9GAMM|nr:EIIBCA-Bgl [Ewingella americana]
MAIDYKMMASQIISNIGGDNNIEYLTHCATRLRFNLKDLTKVNESALNDMPDIIKVINNNSQFQIVIGPRVEHVYRAIEQARVAEPASQTVAEPVEKTSLFNRLLSNISAIFTPYIGVLAGVGMLKGIVVLLQTMNLVHTDAYVFTVFNALASGVFTFLPLFIAVTAAEKFKTNKYIALALTAAMVYPLTTTDIPAAISVFGLSLSMKNLRRRGDPGDFRGTFPQLCRTLSEESHSGSRRAGVRPLPVADYHRLRGLHLYRPDC